MKETLKVEQEALDEYRWLSNDLFPNQEMTNLGRNLAEACAMPLRDAIFAIEFYADRNSTAHSAIEKAVHDDDLHQIASYILRDREAILNGVMVGELATMKTELLSALDHFQKEFFEKIHTKENEDGLKIFKYYEPICLIYGKREEEEEQGAIIRVKGIDRHIERGKSINPKAMSPITELLEAGR